MEAVRTLLARAEPPTSLLGHNDVMAYADLNAAAAAGVAVPRQLSVVGCDDVPLSAWERIDLTTVRLAAAADRAGRRRKPLLDRLENPDAPLRHEVLPVEFIDRSTTAPA